MAKSSGATYQLKVLLSLQDRLSVGLDKSAGKLRSFGKLSDSSLQSFGKLRRGLSRDVNATALDKALAKLRAFNKEAKASTKPVDVAGKVRVGRRRGAGAAEPSAKPPAEYSAKQAADAARVLRLEREKARLVTDQTRAAREQARLAADAASHSLRLQREESGLMQANARARREGQRAASAAELDDLRIAREQLGLSRETEGYRRRRGGVLDRVDRFGHRAESVRGAVYDFRGALDEARAVVNPAIEQMRAEARFRVMGFPEQETARGLASVEQTTKSVRGVTRVESIETFTALTGVFGDVEQAVKFMPIAARYTANMKALHGDKYGPADVARQIQNSFKSLELLGVDRPTGERDATGQRTFTETDRARVEKYFNIIAQASAATGGDINPKEFRDFTKYAGTVGQGITPEGMVKLLPLIPQMGGSRVGSSLMSLSQNLIGGQMHVSKLAEWERYGLIRHKDEKGQPLVERTRDEKIKRMRPGAIPIAEKLLSDPVGFADDMAGVLKQKGVDTSDFKETNKALYGLLANRSSSAVMSQMINFRESLRKESANLERAFPINEGYASIFEGPSPIGQILDARAKWADAEAQAGRPVAQYGGQAASAAADFMLKHPDMAAGLAGVKALGLASAEAAGGVGSLASAIAGLRGGGAGGGGIYGTGAGVSDVVAGGWAGLKALKWVGRGAAGVAGSAVGAAAAPYAAAALGTAAGGIGLYIRHTAGVAGEAADRAAAETIESTRVLRAQAGGRLPDEVAKGLGAAAFAQLNRAGDLTTKVEPGLKGAYQRVYDPSPYSGWLSVYDQNGAAGVFKERAPALQYAEVMRPFIEDVTRRWRAGEISPEAKDRTLKTAATAFPEAYKQATAALQNDMAGLGTSIRSASEMLTTGFNQMRDPAARIPPAFSSVADAASDTASRLGSISFQVPAAPPAAATGPTKQPGGPSLPWLNYGKSAAGSVIERDGLVYLHRGNVVTPAHLSRRSPGDWLDALSALKSFARDDSRAGGGVTRPPEQFNPPQSAAGSVVQGDGLASVHKGNVITPARLSRRSPGDWMEDFRAVRDLRDSLTSADAGAARGPAAPVRLTSAGGDVTNYFYVTVSVPAGSRAAEDPQELARLVGREVQALRSEVAEMRGALYNPDFIAGRAGLAWEMDSERQ